MVYNNYGLSNWKNICREKTLVNKSGKKNSKT